MVDVFLGLGSNVGDREGNIRKALELVDWECVVVRRSPLYRTEPVGYEDQEWFLNCVAEAETGLQPKELIDFLTSVEDRLKRVRTVKNGPRTIDLDILFYDDRIVDRGDLVIPHPRLHERLFVLKPMSDLDPNFVHPVLKKTVKQLMDGLKNPEKVELYR
jgi:dihydroneopterin aldolase / 2-amino-4-hydroxy-6-hydroxymethyldihydropteridine diphosphokinase